MLRIQPLTAAEFAPYGTTLGAQRPDSLPSAINFWAEHSFRSGLPETEVLRVVYSNADCMINSLESHHLTEQALLPITGPIVQIVAISRSESSKIVDLFSLRAFYIAVGQGVCMAPRCWHTTRVVTPGEAQCVMLTRASTTADLMAHLTKGSPLSESTIVAISPAAQLEMSSGCE